MIAQLGINGFGRVGRLVCRAAIENPDATVVAVNDPFLSVDYAAYQFKHDSVHGQFSGSVEVDEDCLIIDGNVIKFFSCSDPMEIPWESVGAKIVCESTGKFNTTVNASMHLSGGAKKVIISGPSVDAPMFVMGVNNENYKGETVFSNATCTANCLAPLAKVLNDEFGLAEGSMTTIHGATSLLSVVDGPAKGGKGWREGRSAMSNAIPAPTSSAKAVEKILPELDGKLNGLAIRIPIADVGILDFTFRTIKSATKEEILGVLKDASKGQMKGILGFTNEKLVSSDFIHEKASCTVDASACIFLNDHFHKVISWYDNEWGYSNRMVDLAIYVTKIEDARS